MPLKLAYSFSHDNVSILSSLENLFFIVNSKKNIIRITFTILTLKLKLKIEMLDVKRQILIHETYIKQI